MENRTSSKHSLIECGNCGESSTGCLKGEYQVINQYEPTDDYYKYSLFECGNCSKPILLKETRAFDSAFMDFYHKETYQIYPTSPFHINPILPDKLQSALEEAIICYRSKSFTATAIMCRRTLEGFCIIKEISEGNLARKIKQLKDQGLINDQLYKWANLLRIAGNEAAHDINIQFDGEDAKDILDFTIAILDFSYSFQDKFDRFMERKSRKDDSKDSS